MRFLEACGILLDGYGIVKQSTWSPDNSRRLQVRCGGADPGDWPLR
jgi:hypothetical protein